MKKKILILIICVLTLTGCTNLNNKDIDELIDIILLDKSNLKNKVFDGYSYYIPKGLKLTNKDEYNMSLLDEYNNTYYFYIDIISYYNQEKLD